MQRVGEGFENGKGPGPGNDDSPVAGFRPDLDMLDRIHLDPQLPRAREASGISLLKPRQDDFRVSGIMATARQNTDFWPKCCVTAMLRG